MKSVLPILAAFALTACDSKTVQEPPVASGQSAGQIAPLEQVVPAEVTPPTQVGTAVQILDFDGKAPAGVKVDGKIQGGLHWKDKNGENLIIFDRAEASRKSKANEGESLLTTTMMARHLKATTTGWTPVRDYKEVVDSCEFDTRADLKTDAKAWSISDLDQDGVAEATWVWYSTCTSDVSPATKKVMMTIGDKKYPLRGNTKVDAGGGDIMGGDFKVDPAFADLDAKFLAHAKKIWNDSGD